MSAVTTVCESDFILLGHDPDLSRRPDAKPGLIDAENRRAALTWDVFRTLELIAPTFWLRRFRARMDILTTLQSGVWSLSVRLWALLPTPAGRGRSEPVCVDTTLARPDAILRVIDAVSWYAGTRDCYIALITSDWSDSPIGSVLIERYRNSQDVLRRRLPHRRDGLMNVRGIGRMTWPDGAGVILRLCGASYLSPTV